MIKTKRGKIIDLSAVIEGNGDTVSAGNASMNAKGDIVDKKGNVIRKTAEVSRAYYKKAQSVAKKASIKPPVEELEKEVKEVNNAKVKTVKNKKTAPPDEIVETKSKQNTNVKKDKSVSGGKKDAD